MTEVGVKHLEKMKSAVCVLVVVAMTSPSFAEPVKPTGPYSEARIEEAKPALAPAKNVPAKPVTLIDEAKRWARKKVRQARAYWRGNKPAPVVARPANQPGTPVSQSVPRQPTSTSKSTSTPSVAPAVSRPVGQSLSAPVEMSGLKRSSSGVAVFDLESATEIPRLNLEKESSIRSSRYALDERMRKVMEERVIHPFQSPPTLNPTEHKRLTSMTQPKPTEAALVKDVVFAPKGKVSRAELDKIVFKLKPEGPLNLQKFVPLTDDEQRFLSGLLLYQQGDKCASAVGLFHKLSRNPDWQSEADYYLAMCSKRLGLKTDFYERTRRVFASSEEHYSLKLLKEIGSEVPYEFVEGIGDALAKLAGKGKFMDKLSEQEKADFAYLMADYGASTNRYKTALQWAKQIPVTHPKHLKAQFLLALAEYQAGSKAEAFAIQEKLIHDLRTDKTKAEFQAIVALNAARMAFQERDFKKAREKFMSVYKDHPLWLQSLTEMGWVQLMTGDHEGAIGNMYSIQSPFFASVYKPESYVIRSIGYLNLCQYGDAYKMLSILEHEYRPALSKMERYITSAKQKPTYYQTVRNFLSAPKEAKEVDGLPVQVIRDMARHRDFTNLQKALNRQLDERAFYDKLEDDIEKSLKRAQWLVNNSRKRSEELRNKIASIRTKPDLESNRGQWNASLEKELGDLNDYFFQVDLFTEAKATMVDYKRDVIGGADKRLADMRSKMEVILANRLLKMKVDLARYLDNNELLRYEVFAGSGENIRYQVAGGETANRIPASVIPKSKSLQWSFDGEYWQDEIGHYRSSLKNNCPENVNLQHASLEGEAE
jgi:hypothetical protein